MARKGKLTEEQRRFVVKELACYLSPQQVADAVRERFGVEMARQSIENYDPEKNLKLSKKWRAHFEICRKKFREDVEEFVPESIKSVRVRELARVARLMDKRGNHVLQAQMYEQIAKECGGSFTNRREISGRDGKPMQFEEVSTMTDEQLDAELAARLRNPAAAAFVAALAGSEATPILAPPTKQ